MTNNVERAIARIESSSRMKAPDGTLTAYVIEVNEWREIRALLRNSDND